MLSLFRLHISDSRAGEAKENKKILQFVTKNDVGKSDNSGFYDDETDLPAPSAKAEKLLEKIGVDMSGEAADGQVETLILRTDGSGKVWIK